MSSEEEEEFICTPPGLRKAAETTSTALIPNTSRERYQAVYDAFMDWKRENKAAMVSENVILAYFVELKTKYLPSTIWSKYSMLGSMLKVLHDIDISKYSKLLAFVKQNAKGFKSKKAKVLTSDEIRMFLNTAPDEQYLAMKVIAIFGVTGTCHTCELVNSTVADVQDHGTMYQVKIPRTKTGFERSFTIGGEFYDVVFKYRFLRPSKALTTRFFLNYRNGRCTSQVIGKNYFTQTPRKIASFLNLPEADRYTGHCFRRTSTTLLAEAGADLLTVKRHGGWKSSTVAEGYIAESMHRKEKTEKLITSPINLKSDDLVSQEARLLGKEITKDDSCNTFNIVEDVMKANDPGNTFRPNQCRRSLFEETTKDDSNRNKSNIVESTIVYAPLSHDNILPESNNVIAANGSDVMNVNDPSNTTFEANRCELNTSVENFLPSTALKHFTFSNCSHINITFKP